MPQKLHKELEQRIASHAWLTRRPRLFPLLVFALAIVSVVVGAWTTEHAEREAEAQRLEGASLEALRFLRQVETTHVAMLRGSGLYLSKANGTQEEFEVLAGTGLDSIDARVAEGIGWAAASPFARGPYPMTLRITFLAPNNDRNRRAIGFDMYAETRRRNAIDKAIKTKLPQATAPVVLVQEGPQGHRLGFLLYTAVFDQTGTVKGTLYAVYQGDTFLKAMQSRLSIHPQFAALYDVTDGVVQIATVGERSDNMIYQDRELNFSGRKWRITVGIPSAAVMAPSTAWIILIGLIMAGLAMLLARQFVLAAIDERNFFEWQTKQLRVRDTLMLELNHRVKNTLANVLSIIALTRGRAKDLDGFANSLTGRVRALSATHDILTAKQWESATLESVINAELAPYLGHAMAQAEMSGPEIHLASNTALSLGLAIHELATNAAKYGALSTPEGTVKVNWEPAGEGLARLIWEERGGPEVVAPARSGFGTSLLRKTVAHELGREVDLDFRPEGLRATLYVPIRPAREFALRQRS